MNINYIYTPKENPQKKNERPLIEIGGEVVII